MMNHSDGTIISFEKRIAFGSGAEEVTINGEDFHGIDLTFYYDRLETVRGTILLTDLRSVVGRTAYADSSGSDGVGGRKVDCRHWSIYRLDRSTVHDSSCLPGRRDLRRRNDSDRSQRLVGKNPIRPVSGNWCHLLDFLGQRVPYVVPTPRHTIRLTPNGMTCSVQAATVPQYASGLGATSELARSSRLALPKTAVAILIILPRRFNPQDVNPWAGWQFLDQNRIERANKNFSVTAEGREVAAFFKT